MPPFSPRFHIIETAYDIFLIILNKVKWYCFSRNDLKFHSFLWKQHNLILLYSWVKFSQLSFHDNIQDLQEKEHKVLQEIKHKTRSKKDI